MAIANASQNETLQSRFLYPSHFQECIKKCLECYETCLSTIPHSFDVGGEYASKDHIGLLNLCAEICQTAVVALSFHTGFHKTICRSCAEICEATATQCDRMAQEDEQLIHCARSARNCAQSCYALANG